MQKRCGLIIKPTVKSLQAQHQPPWVRTEIRLPVLELIMVDGSLKRFLIDPFFHQFRKHLIDRLFKFLLLGFIRIFRDNGKIRLENTVFQSAVYVLPDSLIKQRLLHRRPGCGTKDIVQNFHGNIKLRVKAASHGNIISQVSIFRNRFFFHHRIFFYQLPWHGKSFLMPHLGINLKLVKRGKIILVHKRKIFRRIHVPIQIYIAVGRMIIFPVEIQKLLIGKLRDHIRIPP